MEFEDIDVYSRAIKVGIVYGAAFGVLGIAFVLVSTLTNVDRLTWQVMNQGKGILAFGLCSVAGFVTYGKAPHLQAAACAGIVAGAIGGIVVPLSMYLAAYTLTDALCQYPFEYYSFMYSGADSIQQYLRSDRGRATVFETTIGLIPIVATIAAMLGAASGAIGGWLRRWRDRREVKPLCR